MIYYVSHDGTRRGDGTRAQPFQRIQEAAEIALPGDEIVVGPGIYREHVNPRNSGTRERPITYRAEIDGKSIITGAESVKGWSRYKGDVWFVVVANGVFGDYNPYQTILDGDWYYTSMKLHTGEVYLNGKSMYETDNLDNVVNPVPFGASLETDFSLYQWYTSQTETGTIIYANFHGCNPNEEHVEINVRRNCFYPTRMGIDYITVSGFYLKQAATTWAPPTAYQEGLIGPHWSKGWIIENCEISDSKCVGISLGKYLQSNNENKWTKERLKQGTQTERDSICQAQTEGWTKARIGSHIIRGCKIHDCEQAGIVGHLGCVFSIIEDNHIYDINKKKQLTGAEIAGVKLHAAIDVEFRRNHIHNCTRGLWLDWQAQGTRVSGNFFHDNFPLKQGQQLKTALDIGEDIFIEVSHGPTLIDHNILLSPQSCRIATQGTAFVHNLICGSFTSVGMGTNNVSGIETVSREEDEIMDPGPRYTPYHVPHQTEIAGFMTILHGDNRFYNNLFVQKYMIGQFDSLYNQIALPPQNSIVGTVPFNGFPTKEEYMKKFFRDGDSKGSEDRSKYYTKLPIYTGGNVYFNGALPCDKEENFVNVADVTVKIDIKVLDGAYYLETDIFSHIPQFETPFVSTEYLGEAFEPEQKFENPDGSPILFDRDYLGMARGLRPTAGPFETEEGWNVRLDTTN